MVFRFRLVSNVPTEATWETFQTVAHVLFADGINLGCIVAWVRSVLESDGYGFWSGHFHVLPGLEDQESLTSLAISVVSFF